MDKSLPSSYGGHGWYENTLPQEPTSIEFVLAPMIREWGLKNVEFMVSGVANIRNHAPKAAWYLVAEKLAPLGLTCWLGIK